PSRVQPTSRCIDPTRRITGRSGACIAASPGTRRCTTITSSTKMRRRKNSLMPEQPMPVLQKIPDDQHVEPENHYAFFRKVVDEFVDFDRNEKRRLADRQPAGPRRAERQPDAFHQRK